MKTESQSRSVTGRTGQGDPGVRRATAFLPWTVAAIFVVTNIATLLSERTWLAAHDILAPAIGMVSGDPVRTFPWYGELRKREEVRRAAESLARDNVLLVKRGRELESTVNRLRHENSEAMVRKAEADDRLAKLQAEHAGLRNRHTALETEHGALKDMSVRRAKAVRTVADRISGKLALQAGGMIAELPVRAAPYVGVFAMVTGTALDIRSDCELARTLNGLVLDHQQAPLDTHAVCQYTDRIPAAHQVWNTVKKRSGSMAASVYQTVENLYPR